MLSQVVYLSPEWADVTIAFDWTARATLTEGAAPAGQVRLWKLGGGGGGQVEKPLLQGPCSSLLSSTPLPCVLSYYCPSLAWMSVLLPALSPTSPHTLGRP